MMFFILTGTILSVIYNVATHWIFPGVASGLVWYFGYFACFGLAGYLALNFKAESPGEAVILALKALLPVSGLILLIYGFFAQFGTATVSSGNADVLDSSASMTGPLCIITGIILILLSIRLSRRA